MGLCLMVSRNGVWTGARTLTRVQLCTSPFCVLSSEPYRVIHDREQRRFSIRLDHGGLVQSAVLKYSNTSDGHVHLLSTEVPEPFRGCNGLCG
ncbi:protein NATD1-like isoform X4 [Silurus meridionalis]|uniref:protein NATD1-like isoform X4 n=1 Tax=Silurus meridionalis TaxID=175797 RepID=UPI001EEBA8DE|nr:protein NATD1-like isoform X4 [Silurus meridionalis]